MLVWSWNRQLKLATGEWGYHCSTHCEANHLTVCSGNPHEYAMNSMLHAVGLQVPDERDL